MEKPLVLEINEFEKNEIELVNNCDLPSTIKRRILEDIVKQLIKLEQEEYKLANEKYKKEQEEQTEKDKNLQNKEK